MERPDGTPPDLAITRQALLNGENAQAKALLPRCLDAIVQQLLPAAGRRVAQHPSELERCFRRVELKSLRDTTLAGCLVESEGGTYRIVVHHALVLFYCRMVTMAATQVRFFDDETLPAPAELPLQEDTVKRIVAYTDAYFEGRPQAHGVPLETLTPDQLAMVDALLLSMLRFVLGHELAHVVSGVAERRSGWLGGLGSRLHHWRVRRHVTPLVRRIQETSTWAETKGLPTILGQASDREIGVRWTTEILADKLGIDLCLEACGGQRYERIRAWWGIETALLLLWFLERWQRDVMLTVPDFSTHPPMELRRDAVRARLADAPRGSAPALADFLQGLLDAALKTRTMVARRATPRSEADRLLSLGKDAEAASEYDRALAADPDDVHSLACRGALYLKSKRYEEGLTLLRRAVHLDPTQANAWSNKGVAEEMLGRLDDAVESYLAFIRLMSPSIPAGFRVNLVLRAILMVQKWRPDIVLPPVKVGEGIQD